MAFSWEQRKLGDVVKEVTRNEPCSDAPVMMITANNGFIEQSERYAFNNAGESLKKYILLQKGELAYNHGASKLRPYGSCFALTTAENARIPFVYHCFSAEGINPEFLSIELNGDEIEGQLRRIVSSGARMDGLLNISFDEYTSVSVLLPKKEEQDHIADFFRQLDNLITLHQRKYFYKLTSAGTTRTFQNTNAWEQRKVGDLLIERNQQAPMSDEYPLMAFIASEGVAPKGERYDRSALVTDTVNKLYKKTEKGDFIYSSNNLETGSIGLNKYGKACISPVYSIFEPTGIADSDFLGRRLVRKDFINAMVKWRQGVIYGQWRIHESDFLKIEITVPSVEEQRKIGAYLDQLDNLITLHQRKYFYKFTSAGTIRTFQNTNAWEQRKLGDCFDERNESMPDGELISVTINDGIRKFSELGRHDNSNDDKSKYKKVCVGDIAYNSMRMWQGASGYSPYEGIVSPAYTVLSPKMGVVSRCLAYQFKLPEMIHTFQVNSQGITSDNWNLKYPAFSEIEIAIAKQVKEQELIASFFTSLDNLITLHQREQITENIMKNSLKKRFFEAERTYYDFQ